MSYVRSIREIPLTEEPHASVIAALLPDPTESPFVDVVIGDASDLQRAHLAACPRCTSVLGLDVHPGTGGGQLGGYRLEVSL